MLIEEPSERRLRMTIGMTYRQRAAGLGLLLLVASSGCRGKAEPPMNSHVEGTVTMNGTPLVGVLVEFVPEREEYLPGSNGITDSKGHFTMYADNKKKGAFVCKHRVVIRMPRGGQVEDRMAAADGGGGQPRVPRGNPPVPADYSLAKTTPLMIEVTADKHEYPLELARNKTLLAGGPLHGRLVLSSWNGRKKEDSVPEKDLLRIAASH
jgi:hypothetical protein